MTVIWPIHSSGPPCRPMAYPLSFGSDWGQVLTNFKRVSGNTGYDIMHKSIFNIQKSGWIGLGMGSDFRSNFNKIREALFDVGFDLIKIRQTEHLLKEEELRILSRKCPIQNMDNLRRQLKSFQKSWYLYPLRVWSWYRNGNKDFTLSILGLNFIDKEGREIIPKNIYIFFHKIFILQEDLVMWEKDDRKEKTFLFVSNDYYY